VVGFSGHLHTFWSHLAEDSDSDSRA
jgi:hypothetical protein